MLYTIFALCSLSSRNMEGLTMQEKRTLVSNTSVVTNIDSFQEYVRYCMSKENYSTDQEFESSLLKEVFSDKFSESHPIDEPITIIIDPSNEHDIQDSDFVDGVLEEIQFLKRQLISLSQEKGGVETFKKGVKHPGGNDCILHNIELEYDTDHHECEIISIDKDDLFIAKIKNRTCKIIYIDKSGISNLQEC